MANHNNSAGNRQVPQPTNKPTPTSILPDPNAKIGSHENCAGGNPDLPVVDIGGINHRNPRIQRRTADRIGEIAENTGFLYLKGHGIDSHLIESVYDLSKSFFQKSENFKNQYYIGNNHNHRGYVPVTEKGNYDDEPAIRRYEAFDMGVDLSPEDPDFLSGNPLLGPNIWPAIPNFKSKLKQYFAAMQHIEGLMCEAFETCLNLPRGYFRSHMTKPVSQLRLIHYLEGAHSPDPDEITMGAHTDYECFTILHSKSPGFQVLDFNNRWIEAPPIENTFYFNIGDMLEVWSNGRFVSTPHRVIHGNRERYSIPYFCATNYDAVIDPALSSTLGNWNMENSTHYKPIIGGQHLLTQMLRDFPYLKKRFQTGSLVDPRIVPASNPFESRIRKASNIH